MENKKQLKEIILKIGIEQVESVLDEIKKESFVQNKDAEAREFLIEIFNRMKIRVKKDCPNSVFYDVDELGTVFAQDNKTKDLWVSYTHILSVIESKFGYSSQQTKKLIKSMVEDILNWKGYNTPQHRISFWQVSGWRPS